MNETERNWYAVYTKPKSEKKLNQSLQTKKIQTFLPLLSQKKKWSDRIKIVEEPIFKSYLFVKINFKEESLEVLKDKNAMQFVFFNGKPSTISENDISLIEIFLNEYPEKIKIEELNKLQKGNEVEIQSGPFKGKKAIVEKVKNAYQVILNIPLLNRVIRLEVAKEVLGF
ncbi:MAG: UpxY family transcription antiterminator [Leptospiraceae bacterium]|nr:UpxY family transcription antiterminator [Leptospiraceae bacterium]